jgi:hypothetical protein
MTIITTVYFEECPVSFIADEPFPTLKQMIIKSNYMYLNTEHYVNKQ